MHMLQHEHVMWESKYVCFVCEFEYVFFCARVSVYACVCTYIYSKHFILTSPQAAKGCSVCLCVCVCVCVFLCVCSFAANRVQVILGRTFRLENSSSEQIFEVEKYWIHEQYKDET